MDYETTGAVIKMIISRFGTNILSNKERFIDVFEQYAPDLTKEKKSLALALNENIGNIFKTHFYDREIAVKMVVNALDMFADSFVEFVVSSFAEAFEWAEYCCFSVSSEQMTAQGAYEKGEEFYIGETVATDFTKSFRFMKLAADMGNKNSYYYIGIFFYYGLGGIQQNSAEAERWLSSYINEGTDGRFVAKAAKIIADMYISGYGVKQDTAKAIRNYRLYFSNGGDDADIAISIGLIYQNGLENVPRNKTEAFRWFEIAYRNGGNVLAPYNLALAYFDGDGVGLNKATAFRYFKETAEKGYKEGQLMVADYYYKGIGGIVCNYSEARRWYEMYIENGGDEVSVIYNVAVMYFYGKGVTENKRKAFEYFNRIANTGYSETYKYMGNFCSHGYNVVNVDYAMAFRWYRLYIQNYGEDSEILCNCGVMYHYGRGTAKDEDKAFSLFKRAAELGYTEAFDWLGYYYYNGFGNVKLDYMESCRYYERYVTNGGTNALAFYNLGIMYFYGKGTGIDKNKAISLFQTAANKGNKDAAEMIKNISNYR